MSTQVEEVVVRRDGALAGMLRDAAHILMMAVHLDFGVLFLLLLGGHDRRLG